SRCLRSGSQVSCTCDSHANPTPLVQWRLSGQHVNDSTATPIREEPLGRIGLRSTLTIRQSQEDMPTALCLSSNSQGSASLQLWTAPTVRALPGCNSVTSTRKRRLGQVRHNWTGVRRRVTETSEEGYLREFNINR
uniref:Ig-like domain-containing protein n=1 Tax=Hucho hucho TaxID=62062 RepID=A0A4W5LZB0_9TELE